jgi:sulfopyruvate decarboxylase TPP-binding subunit
MKTAAGTGPDLIVEQLLACGIKCVTSTVEDWSLPLLERIDEEPSLRHIRVAREVDTVGITAGSFFAGAPSVAIIGISGLLTAFHELATFNRTHQVPMFVLGVRRGGLNDPKPYQMQQSTVGLASLEGLGVDHDTIDAIEHVGRIQEAYMRSRLQKQPYVLFLDKPVLHHGLDGR